MHRIVFVDDRNLFPSMIDVKVIYLDNLSVTHFALDSLPGILVIATTYHLLSTHDEGVVVAVSKAQHYINPNPHSIPFLPPPSPAP